MKALLGMLIVQVMFFVALRPVLNKDELRVLLGFFVGLWILMVLIIVVLILSRWRFDFEVYTIMDLPPSEASDRLERTLRKGIGGFEKTDKNPMLHGEQARFRVTMDSTDEATVVVALIHQSREGPTKIIVRSTQRRDEWRELRALVEDALDDMGVPDR